MSNILNYQKLHFVFIIIGILFLSMGIFTYLLTYKKENDYDNKQAASYCVIIGIILILIAIIGFLQGAF